MTDDTRTNDERIGDDARAIADVPPERDPLATGLPDDVRDGDLEEEEGS